MRTNFFTGPRWTPPTITCAEDLAESVVLDGHNLAPEILADLDFIITGETDREPTWLSEADAPVGVFQLPDEFVTALAELPDERLAFVSDEWGMAAIRGDATYLVQVRQIAREAIAHDEGLYIAVFY